MDVILNWLIWVPLIVLQILWFVITIGWIRKNVNTKRDN